MQNKIENKKDSKTAPRILIFSIAMGADYSFYVESIATYAPAVLARVNGQRFTEALIYFNMLFYREFDCSASLTLYATQNVRIETQTWLL